MATKAAKSITINATKYELANALDVANGKLQLKAKDVVLDEVEVDGGKYIAINLVRDPDRDDGVGRGYLIGSIDTSDNIDPTTYTGQDMANDFLAGGLKIVAHVPSNGWSDDSYIEISELNVFNNSEGEITNYYYSFLGAGLSTAEGNDNVKYKLSIDGLSTADTLDSLRTPYHHATLYSRLDAWVTPPQEFIIDLADGQEMFDFTNTTWTCKAFNVADLKVAIATGKRIIIRSKNYRDQDNPTTNKMYLTCTMANDSYSGNQVMLEFFDGIKYYSVLTAYTGTITSLNVYHETH